LFRGLWPPLSVSLDVRKVKGTHGRSSGAPEELAYFGATIPELARTSSLVETASLLQQFL